MIQDSGTRQTFEDGSTRDSEEGKGRYDLLPQEAIHRLAKHYQVGARKYKDRNWEKGQPFSRGLSSLLRHAFKWGAGHRDEDHLAAVAWNAFMLMTFEERVQAGELSSNFANLPWCAEVLGSPDTLEDLLQAGQQAVEQWESCEVRKSQEARTTFRAPKERSSLLIYLAGPIRSPKGVWYQEQNVCRAEVVARKLWQWGYSVICPHTNTRFFDGEDLLAEQIMAGDLTQLFVSDLVVILPGWEGSQGTCREKQEAEKNQIPLVMWTEEFTEESFAQCVYDKINRPQV